jgi:HAD superfamily phosphoserine phosphatase-like hydrolase
VDAPSQDLALFDFDGTITSTDTWTPFMRFAVSPGRLFVGRAVLAPVIVGYRLGAISASRGRQIATRVAFQGASAAVARRLGAEYAATVLPRTVRWSALDRIEAHRSRGDHVVIVSAALDLYLGPWCGGHRLDYICSTLEERQGRLTGRYLGRDCVGPEKVRRVHAYGDSGDDREMLELAHTKYYCWREISSWDEVTSFGHPDAR